MFMDTDESIQNIEGFMLLDKMKFSRFRTRLLEMGVKRFRRLRSKIVKKYGFYFWKAISSEKAIG